MDKKKILKKWNRWLKENERELSWLLTSQDVFKEIGQIYQKNKNIQRPTLFQRFIIYNYADAISSGIRRLADKDKRTNSLYNLIQDISINPNVLTRKDFIRRYPKWMRREGLADRDFDKFSEIGQDQVSVNKLKKDMKSITDASKRIKTHVDKNVAHLDKNRRRFKPLTFSVMDKALQKLDKIYCKYYLLLTGGGMATCEPAIQYDWKEVLRHPWIAKNNK